MNVVPSGNSMFSFSGNVEVIASNSLLVFSTTGYCPVVDLAITPLIKVYANPETYENFTVDMDVNAGKIIKGEATIQEVGA